MKIKRMLTGVIVLSLIVSLSSCKSDDSKKITGDLKNEQSLCDQQSQSLDIRYSAQQISFPDSIKGISDIKCCKNMLYIDAEEQCMGSELKINCVDISNKKSNSISLNQNVSWVFGMCESDNDIIIGARYLNDNNFCNENCIYKIDATTGNKIAELATDNSDNCCLMKNIYNSQVYILSGNTVYIYDNNLQLINSSDLSGMFSDSEILSAVNDKNGNIYLTVSSDDNYGIAMLDSNLNLQYCTYGFIDIGGKPSLCIDMHDEPALYSYDSDYIYIDTVNGKDGSVKDRYEIPVDKDYEYLFNRTSDADLIIISESKIKKASFDGSIISESDISVNTDNSLYISNGVLYEFIPSEFYSGSTLYIEDYNGQIINQKRNGNSVVCVNPDGRYSVYEYDDKMHISCYESDGSLKNEKEINYPDSNQYCLVSGESKDHLYLKNDEGGERAYFECTSGGDICNKIIIKDGLIIKCEFVADNIMYVVCDNDNKPVLYTIGDKKLEKLREIQGIDASKSQFVKGDNAYDMYIISDNNVYGYDVSENMLTEIIQNTPDLGIGIINNITCSEDHENIFCTTTNICNVVYMLKKDDSDKGITKINIACVGEPNDSQIKNDAVKFNQQGNEYRIVVTDYDNFSKLNMDIVADKIPDIIISGNEYEIKKYADKKLLTDLSVMMENDKDISKENFMDNIMSIYQSSGGIYSVFPSFKLNTMVTNDESLSINNGSNLTYKNFFDKFAHEDPKLFYVDDRYKLLESFIPYYLSDFMDIDNGTCDFENEVFINLLKMIKSQECFNDYDNSNTYLKFNDNLCKVDICDIYGFSNMYDVKTNEFSDTYDDLKIKICGFPGATGSSSYILLEVCFGISEDCKYKDQAWDFVKKYFTADYQKSMVTEGKGGCFPVRKDAYDIMFNMSKAIDDSEYSKEVDNAVRFADKALLNISSVNDIIIEEASAYFEGNDSPESVASSVQSKVKLFMSEMS